MPGNFGVPVVPFPNGKKYSFQVVFRVILLTEMHFAIQFFRNLDNLFGAMTARGI